MILPNLPIQNLKELELQKLIFCGSIEEIGTSTNNEISVNETKFQDKFLYYIKNYFNKNGCTPSFRSPTMRWDLEQHRFMMDFLSESN